MRKVAAAVVIGTATIVVMKPDARTHWAVPPTIHVEQMAEQTGDDDPFEPRGGPGRVAGPGGRRSRS